MHAATATTSEAIRVAIPADDAQSLIEMVLEQAIAITGQCRCSGAVDCGWCGETLRQAGVICANAVTTVARCRRSARRTPTRACRNAPAGASRRRRRRSA